MTASIGPTLPASSSNSTLQKAAPRQSFLSRIWGEDGFSFGDILDILNPLQHAPIVSTLYRAFTGDAIASAPRILGAALFGGPIGAATGLANAALKYLSGKDVGEHVLTLLPLPTRSEGENVMLAFAPPPSSPMVNKSLTQEQLSRSPQHSAPTRAIQQAQLVTALDAYTKNSRPLATSQIQNRFGIRL